MRKAKLEYSVLEPRILFAADQPTDQTDITTKDTSSVDATVVAKTAAQTDTTSKDAPAPAPAPATEPVAAPDTHVLVVAETGTAPVADAVHTQVVDAANAVQALVRDFLSGADAKDILDQVFRGDGPSAERTARIDAFLAELQAQNVTMRIELVDGNAMRGAYGAFAATTPEGPTIYLDRQWVEGGASQAALVRVIAEEFGHFIDRKINGSVDTAGDEGEAFALKALKINASADDWLRISTENDFLNMQIDGRTVETEMAALLFTDVWETTPSTLALEENSYTVGARLTGAKFLFQSTNPADPWFSGNNTQGTLYTIDSSNNVITSYFGEMSRLVKTGSKIDAIQFYVYNNPANPSDTGSPGTSLLVRSGQTAWTATVGMSIQSSSDPISTALNSLLPAPTPPTAGADAGTASEAGGVSNATGGTTATGNVLSNDSLGGTTYSIVGGKLVTGSTSQLSITGVSNSLAGTSGTANGSSIAGLYGSITVAADGSYTYTVDNSKTAVEALRLSSNTLSDVFTYTLSDGRGGVINGTLTVTITGTNDDPIAKADYNVAKESTASASIQYTASDTTGYKATGNVVTNDTDVDANGETKTIIGLYGAASGTTVSSIVMNFTAPPSNVKAGYYVFQGNSTTAVLDSAGKQLQIATISGGNITLTGTPATAIANGTKITFTLKSDGTGSKGSATLTTTSLASSTIVSVSVACPLKSGPP